MAESEKSVYRVGVEDVDYFPLFTRADKLEDQGYIIELMQIFAEQANLEFEFVRLPIARFPDWYKNNDIDLRVPDNPLWTNNELRLSFSQGILNLDTVTLTLPKNRSKNLSDFKSIGTIQGFTPSPYWQIQLQNQSIKFVYEGSMKILIQLLNNGIVDGLDVNPTVARLYATLLGYPSDSLVVAEHSPTEHLQYHLSTIEHPKVIEKFNQFLVENSATVEALKIRYQL